MSKMRETDTHVYFYGGPFSQWYPAKFRARLFPGLDETMEFSCAEQYMMARKAMTFGDIATCEAIMKTTSPAEHKALGRAVQGFNEVVWTNTSPTVVLTASLYKYQQNLTLLNRLRATNGKILVEGSSKDRIWGVGLSWDDPRIEDERNWLGQNLLGRSLMATRSILENVPNYTVFG